MPTQAQRIWSGKSALSFALLFGAVNLFADMTYEGARSVAGPFLGMLGASGFVGRVEREPQASRVGRYPAAYWWYCLGAGLVGFGFADFSLISFHFSKSQIVPNDWIAVFYALAMGAGGLGSLVIGKLLNRVGLLVLLPVTIMVAIYASLAFFGGFVLSLVGALFWGIGLGAHESVMQAAVAEMVSQERLGSAYGLFGTAFGGVAWFAGSAALGALYDVSIKATVALAVVAQLLAVVPLAIAARRMRTH